ncbi:MAG TPA: hypothetical protein ENN13_05400 [Candidatus Altiarchaeales archaeon]|nr:hypothetical protein [Candidatus Altiarchaeales archaeon]
MNDFKPIALVALIYLCAMLAGLQTGEVLINAIRVEKTVEPFIENPESLSAGVGVFAYIIAATAIFLVLIKLGLKKLISFGVYLSLFAGVLISTSTYLGGLSIIFSAILILLFRFRRTLLVLNATLVLSVAGIGGILGSNLGFTPAILLLLLLAAYDIIAVFGTKHMVTLAKAAEEGIPLMISIPASEGKNIGLGTGDLAIPITFCVSLIYSHGMATAAFTMLGGLVGLVSLFIFGMKRRGMVLPALPPITLGLLIGFGIMWIFASL